MDALTYIPRLILGFYGRMLEYAVDISLTAVGLAENITLSCIGAVMGGVQVCSSMYVHAEYICY